MFQHQSHSDDDVDSGSPLVSAGVIGGLIAGTLFGVFMGMITHSAAIGLYEGAIFAVCMTIIYGVVTLLGRGVAATNARRSGHPRSHHV